MRWGTLQEIRMTYACAFVDGNGASVLEFRSEPGIFLFTNPRLEIPRRFPAIAVVNEQVAPVCIATVPSSPFTSLLESRSRRMTSSALVTRQSVTQDLMERYTYRVMSELASYVPNIFETKSLLFFLRT